MRLFPTAAIAIISNDCIPEKIIMHTPYYKLPKYMHNQCNTKHINKRRQKDRRCNGAFRELLYYRYIKKKKEREIDTERGIPRTKVAALIPPCLLGLEGLPLQSTVVSSHTPDISKLSPLILFSLSLKASKREKER